MSLESHYQNDVYHREGGPQLPVSRLIERLDAYIALIGLAQMKTVPEQSSKLCS